MKETENPRREEALDVLKTLARRLRSINADIVFVSLIEGGFSDDEACKLTGALFRTAKARNWLTKTDYSIKSQRNHSNLQSVWLSNLFGKKPNGKPLADSEIRREYARWKNAGYSIPDVLATTWEATQKDKNYCEVTYQQAPKDMCYGCSVMKK
jgi:hypothetical protein